MADTLTFSADTLTTLNVVALAAALVIMVVVVFFAASTVRTVKSEFAKVKDALGKVASGTFKDEMPQGDFRESAEVLTYIERLAENMQRQREAITILAFSDHLTSLANRMRFEDELTRGFNFAKRGLSIAVVLINVREFGAVNRKLGRDSGDHLLKLIADILRKNIRKTDLAARFDSDDFAVILPNMETGKIVGWLEQLEQRFVDAQQKDPVLSAMEPRRLRMGYSFVQELMDKDAHEVWERASRALEQTTESGKAAIIGA